MMNYGFNMVPGGGFGGGFGVIPPAQQHGGFGGKMGGMKGGGKGGKGKGGGASVAPAGPPRAAPGDPKSSLAQLCQKLTRRAALKTDVEYSTAQYGQQYQATVKLNCFNGEAYAGALEANQKLAEMSAAQHAIKDLDPTYQIKPLATIMGTVNPGAQKPKAAGVAGTAGAVAQPAPVNNDPKSELNQFCQRYCKRPITKTDIVYTCQKFGDQQQATVALNCINGAEYAGELRPTSKEAEKSAAEQALLAHASDIANLPAATTKRKAKPAGATTGVAGEMSGTPAQPAAKKAKTDGATDPAANACITPKTQLNTLAMKLSKRALKKGETVYECLQVEGGYQATVQLSALPGEYATVVWAGTVCATKQAAEQSAAEIALAQLSSDPNLKPDEAAEKKSKGKGKGKDWGDDDWAKGKGKGWGFTKQSELPRTRVSEEDRTGKVVVWMGHYGWILPDVTVDHESAKRREGKIYVNKRDLKSGSPEMGQGALVKFKLFEDPSGVGAEEVFVTKEAPKTEKPAAAPATKTAAPKEFTPAPKVAPAKKA